jgi:aerobic-type carbon monoxide dehydrogenase small subunit (CoxS/CutS family)
MMDRTAQVTITVNGDVVTRRVEARQHLVDFLREELQLTGSHVGCEHGARSRTFRPLSSSATRSSAAIARPACC